MMVLAEPSAEGLCAAVEQALQKVPNVCPHRQHEQVGKGQLHTVEPCITAVTVSNIALAYSPSIQMP